MRSTMPPPPPSDASRSKWRTARSAKTALVRKLMERRDFWLGCFGAAYKDDMEKYDSALAELWDWCVQQQMPFTTVDPSRDCQFLRKRYMPEDRRMLQALSERSMVWVSSRWRRAFWHGTPAPGADEEDDDEDDEQADEADEHTGRRSGSRPRRSKARVDYSAYANDEGDESVNGRRAATSRRGGGAAGGDVDYSDAGSVEDMLEWGERQLLDEIVGAAATSSKSKRRRRGKKRPATAGGGDAYDEQHLDEGSLALLDDEYYVIESRRRRLLILDQELRLNELRMANAEMEVRLKHRQLPDYDVSHLQLQDTTAQGQGGGDGGDAAAVHQQL